MRHLDTLDADIQQPEDEGRIEPRRAHDRRDPDALGRHYCELHIVQVEAGVLHVDESGIEAGEPISSTICGSAIPPTWVPKARPPSLRMRLTRFSFMFPP